MSSCDFDQFTWGVEQFLHPGQFPTPLTSTPKRKPEENFLNGKPQRLVKRMKMTSDWGDCDQALPKDHESPLNHHADYRGTPTMFKEESPMWPVTSDGYWEPRCDIQVSIGPTVEPIRLVRLAGSWTVSRRYTPEFGSQPTISTDLATPMDWNSEQSGATVPRSPFSCSLCPFSTPKRHLLKQHSMTHKGGHPIECVFCNRRFKSIGGCKVHLRRIHGIVESSEGFQWLRKHQSPSEDTPANLPPAGQVGHELTYDLPVPTAVFGQGEWETISAANPFQDYGNYVSPMSPQMIAAYTGCPLMYSTGMGHAEVPRSHQPNDFFSNDTLSCGGWSGHQNIVYPGEWGPVWPAWNIPDSFGNGEYVCL